jgi:hypothetical protein
MLFERMTVVDGMIKTRDEDYKGYKIIEDGNRFKIVPELPGAHKVYSSIGEAKDFITDYLDEKASRGVKDSELAITKQGNKYKLIGAIKEQELQDQGGVKGFDTYQEAVNAIKKYGYTVRDNKDGFVGSKQDVKDDNPDNPFRREGRPDVDLPNKVNGNNYKRRDGFWIQSGTPNFMGGSAIRVTDPSKIKELDLMVK